MKRVEKILTRARDQHPVGPSVGPSGGPSAESLLKHLDFSPEDVVRSASLQPRLFMQAAEYRMEKFRARTTAKMHRDVVKAEQSLQLREEARNAGEKITEAIVEASLLKVPEVLEAEAEYAAADEAQEFAWLLVEAYRQRRDCLRIVSDLVGAEFAMQKAAAAGAEKIASVKDKLRKKWPG